MTDYAQIQKWWEMVMSAYLLVSLHSNFLKPSDPYVQDNTSQFKVGKFSTHDWWDEGRGWKNILNNLRLILQPFVLFNLIKPWLKVFPIPHLSLGFSRLIALMNLFRGAVPTTISEPYYLFSSA